MKDIKINKIKTNKNAETKTNISVRAADIENDTYLPTNSVSKKRISIFSASLFGLMTLSISCYIFMISSSVFYAVQKSQFEFKAESISGANRNSNIDDDAGAKIQTDRISYINTDLETSISLK